MPLVRDVDSLQVTAASFVVGVLATTLFLVVVFEETVRAAAVESVVYAAGGALVAYLTSTRLGRP